MVDQVVVALEEGRAVATEAEGQRDRAARVVEVREAYEAQHELERAQYGDLSSADRRALAAALETLIDTPLDKSMDETSGD